MSDTNFYDSLKAFAAQKPLRAHMPGHKGKSLPMQEWDALAALDFTELAPTGNLYGDGDDWLEEAERLWAWDWGMDTAFFATGGSTQGIFTLFSLFTRPGDTVLIDRVSHRSVHNALVLFDLHPIWLEREWDAQHAVAGAPRPDRLEAALCAHPEITAVLLTSPTYYGVCAPLDEAAAICHAHGAKLLCDGAHGAHLPMVLSAQPCGALPWSNPYRACDGVTVSTHKTLPAPGQTAVIFANGVRMEALRAASALTSKTSPSYPMLAALDCLRVWMRQNREAYLETAALAARLRAQYPCMRRADLDPCRVTLQVEDGYALSAQLESRGIYPEMADSCHVVLIFTAADGVQQFDALRQALDALGLRDGAPFAPELPAPPPTQLICSPRAARFAPHEEVSLQDAVGRVCAQCVAPYPPGVPVLAPGERVDEKNVAYLQKLCYDKRSMFVVEER